MAVAYTILSQDRSTQGKRVQNVQIAYTTEAYSSGLPVSGASIGLPTVIESLQVYDCGAAGVHCEFNGGKIRLFQSPAVAATPSTAAALSEVSGNQTITVKVIAVGW